MKTALFLIALLCCLHGNAQFQLFDFDVNTSAISELKYTEFRRLLSDASGTYYKPHEIVFPAEARLDHLTFDTKGYVISRKTSFDNRTFTYATNYSSVITNDLLNHKKHTNTLVPVGKRIVFVSDTETGPLQYDAQNRVVRIPNTKFSTQDITITYTNDQYTIKGAYSNRTFNAEGKEIINDLAGADYIYYNAKNGKELNVRVNFTYVAGYDFYLYEYDAKGNWTTRVQLYYNTGFGNDEWRLEEIMYREVIYTDGSVSKPTGTLTADRSKYMELATTVPTIDYDPLKNGYAAYVGKTNLLNLKSVSNTSISTEKTVPNSDCLAGDCKDGFGKKKIEHSTVQGIFSKGKLNTIAIQDYGTGVYQGEYSNGIRNGYGIYTWNETGQTYIGTWNNGKQDGFGIVMQGDSVLQAGEYEAGKQKLNYVQPFQTGVENGNCTGNCSNGFGKFTFNNGDWYMGFFNNGQFFKLGIYYFNNEGTMYWGTYDNTKMHGSGHYYTKEYTYIGNFKEGNINGKGIKKFNSGKMEAGRFEGANLLISYGKL